VENHDTGSSQRHWPFPDDRLAIGYAYIMTHPGLPCVFWEHYFPSSEQDTELRTTIDALMQVRRGLGPCLTQRRAELEAMESMGFGAGITVTATFG
jgi:hypothetical protein